MTKEERIVSWFGDVLSEETDLRRKALYSLCELSPEELDRAVSSLSFLAGVWKKSKEEPTKDTATPTDLLARAEVAEARCARLDEARENANEACAKWEGMYRMALERAEKAENERDAAVEQLRGLCSACKHYTPYHNDGPCATCTHEVACFAPEKATDKWEWVGVKEE